MMKKELLIFGSSGALGKGITKILVSKGYHKIYLFDRKPDRNSNKIDSIKKVATGDLTLEENISKAFEALTPGKDKLFFLISTIGGFSGGKTIAETDLETWEKMFDMNLKTSFLISKHFVKLVEKSAGGSILFTAALTGLEPEAKKAAYGASKSALIHLVKSLSKEGISINMTANSLAPYIIDTPANRKWMSGTDIAKSIKPVDIGELAHSIFLNFHIISGSVIKLTNTLHIKWQ